MMFWQEESDLSNKSDYLWICDPLDGTIPFSHGIPTATFSLALVKEGIPILGVVYDPFSDRLYYAEKDKGASLNNKRIKVNNIKNPEHQIIGMVISKMGLIDTSLAVRKLVKKRYKILCLCSIVYQGMLVASGESSGIIFSFTTAHDGAAIKIIIEEAGGKTSDLYGNSQKYDINIKGFVASNGIIHDELLDSIKD